MSTINPANNIEFITTDALFGRVRRRLSSFDAAGVIDEGDWYYWIKEIMDLLGVAVYDECEAIVTTNNFKAPLPDNFSYLYAAYRCSSVSSSHSNNIHPQRGMVFYIDHTVECYDYCKNGCGVQRVMSGDKHTYQYVIEGATHTMNLGEPSLLQLAAHSSGVCAKDCQNKGVKGSHQIAIDKGQIFTNFNDDVIYLKYYGFPVDRETGLPSIPSNTIIAKAIEDYIVYNVFNDFILNGNVPDIDKKYQIAKMNHDDSMKQALYFCKLPSFQTVINKIRKDRKNLSIYQQTI